MILKDQDMILEGKTSLEMLHSHNGDPENVTNKAMIFKGYFS